MRQSVVVAALLFATAVLVADEFGYILIAQSDSGAVVSVDDDSVGVWPLPGPLKVPVGVRHLVIGGVTRYATVRPGDTTAIDATEPAKPRPQRSARVLVLRGCVAGCLIVLFYTLWRLSFSL